MGTTFWLWAVPAVIVLVLVVVIVVRNFRDQDEYLKKMNAEDELTYMEHRQSETKRDE